jgi:hypothetical protein
VIAKSKSEFVSHTTHCVYFVTAGTHCGQRQSELAAVSRRCAGAEANLKLIVTSYRANSCRSGPLEGFKRVFYLIHISHISLWSR